MQTFVRVGERSFPRVEIEQRGLRGASAFASLGLKAGETVALILRNDFPFLEATLGAGVLGLYVTPVNWHNTAAEAAYILNDCKAKAIVIHADLLHGLKSVLPAGVPVFVVETPADIRAAYHIAPEACAVPNGARLWSSFIEGFPPYTGAPVEAPGAMIYTSGTTGKPKGVRRLPPTPEQAVATQAMVATLFGADGRDPETIVSYAAGPLYHSTPNAWGPYFFRLGANVIIAPRFDAEGLLRDIERYRVTHLLTVPTMFVRLLKLPEEVRKKYDLSSLQFVMHGAAPCPVEVKRRMIEWWGPVIWEHYGGTETGAVTICDSKQWLAHPGTVGCALPDAEVRVLGKNGETLPPNEVGEVACWRPAYPDFTYNGDDEKRRKAGRGTLLSLGDVGHLDSDGFLYLSGRSSDMVISGGVNIYPAEIESEIYKMPGVADCAVFGIPDEEFGEQVCAFIQPQPGQKLGIDAVKGFLADRLARYKIPKRIEFVDTLPREDSGKIFKRKLREPFWANAGRAV